MEDVELIDYSSDVMTGEDIWVGSEGLDLNDLLAFPRLGSEMPLPAEYVMDSPLSGLSPSEVITSPGQVTCVLPLPCTGEPRVDLQGDASWREAGVFFSSALGFPADTPLGGFTDVEVLAKAAEDGGTRLEQEPVGGREHYAGDAHRVPLDRAEQRGFASPGRDSGCVKEPPVGGTGSKKGRSGTGKKRRKWIKVKEVRNHAVGEDIEWSSVLQMATLTLVGKVLGHKFTRKTVAEWAEEKWKPLVGYAPVVVMLTRGWFAFRFKKEEELRRVLNMNWQLKNAPVLLKLWHPLFDASRERVDVSPVWVRMPALPLHYWDPYHFRKIGDILGTFLEADMSFLETLEQRVARILVNINLREGLAERINLDWGPVIIPQLLDYENVPFRCRRCHEYGHPASECSKPQRPHHGGRNPSPRRSEGCSSERGSDTPVFDSSTSEDRDSELPVEPGVARPVTAVTLDARLDGENEIQREEATQGGPVAVEPEYVHLEMVPSPQAVADPRGSPNPGTPSYTLSPSVNLFMNSVSFLGNDWIEGLQKLSLAGPSGSVVSRLCTNYVGKEPLGLTPCLDYPSVSPPVDCTSVVGVLPHVLIDPDPGDSSDEGLLSPSDSLESGYFLRSCKKASSAGLGKSAPPGRKGRGRKSYLQKAQSRARVDLLEGKQQTIEKALRAENAKKRGR